LQQREEVLGAVVRGERRDEQFRQGELGLAERLDDARFFDYGGQSAGIRDDSSLAG